MTFCLDKIDSKRNRIIINANLQLQQEISMPWPLIIIKGAGISLFLVQVIFFGLLPMQSSFSVNLSKLSMSLCLGGGLFLSVSILHILPQANESISNFLRQNYSIQDPFPFAYFILLLVFFLIVAFNQICQENHKHTIEQQQTHERSLLQSKEIITHKNSTLVLQIGIAIHAVFQGIGIGIQKEFGSTLSLILAVAIHKWAQGLTLGIQFKKQKFSKQKWKIFILAQALVNPIGIILGVLLSQSNELVEGIFTSISAGTFLYISTFEMLREGFQQKSMKKRKLMVMGLGLAIASSLWFIEHQWSA